MPQTENKTSLQEFCNYMMEKYIHPNKMHSEIIAGEFRKYFNLPKFIILEDLLKLSIVLGIKDVFEITFPNRKLRGFHHKYDCKEYELYYRKGDWEGSKEHTFLHEVREMIDELFAHICPTYEKLEHNQLESLSNEFAASVLMPSKEFINDMYETGFDLMELRKKYLRSYSSTLIRMNRVLQGYQCFVGVLYEDVNPIEYLDKDFLKQLEGIPQPLETTYVVKTPRIWSGKHRGRILWHNLPRKGKFFEIGSIADSVVSFGQSVYREKASGFDLYGYDDFSIIARPVHWSKGLAKIAVIAVPYDNRHLLKNQIDRINPVYLPPSFQIF